MTDTRDKDANWMTLTKDNCYQPEIQYARASLAVLMDLRDELKRLNNVLHCHNFLSIPHKLDAIKKNTTKRKRKPVPR